MTETSSPRAMISPAATSVLGSPLPALAEATHALNAWLEIDLDALDANVRTLRGAVGPAVELIAIVKANAYGAGVAGLAPALEAAGVDRFGVVWVTEALALRRFGCRLPILVLGHAFPEEAEEAVRQDITLTCHSLALGEALSRAAVRLGKVARVHVHLDSGLHREGVSPKEAVTLANALRGLPALEVEGLSTHMANADEPDDSYSELQAARFAPACRELDWIPYHHAANSATSLRRSAARYQGVRLGLTLHGVLPANTPGPALHPILALKARLARVSEVPAGDGVGYGLTWRAKKPSRVGLVPVGYADGWPRALGNRGYVLIAGRRCPMVGRVMMDQFVVDLSALPAPPREGDEVVLLGTQGGERITADSVAELAGTIPWDVVASLQARLPRLFHRGGRVERVVAT